MEKGSREAIEEYGSVNYVQDVYGKSKEKADEVKQKTIQTFETFLSLPKDYPVEIVEGIPDALCQGCAIGEHCRKLFREDSIFKLNVLKGDGIFMDHFLKELRNLDMPKPIITQEKVHFLDAQPQNARRMLTTVGITREVIKEERAIPSSLTLILKWILRKM